MLKMISKQILFISLFILYSVKSFKIPRNTSGWHSKSHEFSEEPVIDVYVDKKLVTFQLLTKDNPTIPVVLTEENLQYIMFNAEKIFVLIHGYFESKNIPWYQDLKSALLYRYITSFIIEVDWSIPASEVDYEKSAAATRSVGKIVGDFLITIHNKRKVSTKNMTILGHSLGAHVSGFAGKTVEIKLPKISRIVGMDPAAPLFEDKTCENRLCKTDADVVEVLHTDAGDLGYSAAIGTIDFYANGGYQQNGCENSIEPFCDHSRSFMYITEAIRYPTHFVCRRCSNYQTYEERREECDNVDVLLGDFRTTNCGTYYFDTNKYPPFSLED